MTRAFVTRLAAAALASAALAGPAASEEPRKPAGVVELFTSQGCSSCPPADAILADLAAKGDVIALGYHVDYWDYLGWRDTLGTADNTARQQDYGKAFGVRSVYTPQAVINGRLHVNGADRSAVDGTIESLAGAGNGLTIDLDVVRIGDSFMIDAGSATGPYNTAHLVLVYFDGKQPVVIDRGENKGATVTYWNAVSEIQTAGMWHGAAKRFELPASEIMKKNGCAALLQSVDKDGLPGPILGAAIIHGDNGSN
jgi:hypothetical protein